MWEGDRGHILGMLILWVQGRGVRGQILGILYFGRGGSVRGFWGHTLGMLIPGASLETDMGNVHIIVLWGVGEFWDRHRRCKYCSRIEGLGQRLRMLIFGVPCGGYI